MCMCVCMHVRVRVCVYVCVRVNMFTYMSMHAFIIITKKIKYNEIQYTKVN